MTEETESAKVAFDEGMALFPLNVQAQINDEIAKACNVAKFLCDSRTESRQVIGMAIATGISIEMIKLIEGISE